MTELNQVTAAVIRTLESAGLAAVAAYDGPAKRYPGAVAAVDVAVEINQVWIAVEHIIQFCKGFPIVGACGAC